MVLVLCLLRLVGVPGGICGNAQSGLDVNIS